MKIQKKKIFGGGRGGSCRERGGGRVGGWGSGWMGTEN